jgi:hypothetical protein
MDKGPKTKEDSYKNKNKKETKRAEEEQSTPQNQGVNQTNLTVEAIRV